MILPSQQPVAAAILPAQQPVAAAADGRACDQMATTKIFVGGIHGSVDDTGLRVYFETYGTVLDAHVKRDHLTKRSRGGLMQD